MKLSVWGDPFSHVYWFLCTAPQRTSCAITAFQSPPPTLHNVNEQSEEPQAKRQKVANGDKKAPPRAEDIMEEAGRFARLLAYTVDPDTS